MDFFFGESQDPEVSEAPKTKGRKPRQPKEPKEPKGPKPPKEPKPPKAPKTPKEPKPPKVPKTPKEPKAPKQPKAPKAPRQPKEIPVPGPFVPNTAKIGFKKVADIEARDLPRVKKILKTYIEEKENFLKGRNTRQNTFINQKEEALRKILQDEATLQINSEKQIREIELEKNLAILSFDKDLVLRKSPLDARATVEETYRQKAEILRNKNATQLSNFEAKVNAAKQRKVTTVLTATMRAKAAASTALTKGLGSLTYQAADFGGKVKTAVETTEGFLNKADDLARIAKPDPMVEALDDDIEIVREFNVPQPYRRQTARRTAPLALPAPKQKPRVEEVFDDDDEIEVVRLPPIVTQKPKRVGKTTRKAAAK